MSNQIAEIDEQTQVFAPQPVAQSIQRVQPTTPSTLLSLAVQQGADLDRLEKLFEMQVRWEANEARKAFAESFADFKANEIVRIVKDKNVNFEGRAGVTNYNHATIGNVVRTITEAISKYGFSHNWITRQEGPIVTVSCVLKHKLGHSEEVSLACGVDVSGGKNAIQALGSAITYLQRYTLLSITGCAASDQHDDDGRNAGGVGNRNDYNDHAAARQGLEDAAKSVCRRARAAKSFDDLMVIWGAEVEKFGVYPDLYKEVKSAFTKRRNEIRNQDQAATAN